MDNNLNGNVNNQSNSSNGNINQNVDVQPANQQINLNHSNLQNNVNAETQQVPNLNTGNNNLYQNGVSSPNAKKTKKFNILFVIVPVIIVIVGLVGYFLLFNNDTGINNVQDDSKLYNIVVKEIAEVNVKTYISSGKEQLIVSLTNRTKNIIGRGEVKVSYFDENNNEIGYGDSDFFGLLAKGKESILVFELPRENYREYYVPARIEVEVVLWNDVYSQQELDEYVDYFSYSYDIDINERKINIHLKNNSIEEEDEPCVSIIFYKKRRPVYVIDASFLCPWKDIGPGEVYSKWNSLPSRYIEDGKFILDYDTIEINRHH